MEKTMVRQKFRKYVLSEEYPDPVVFGQIYHTSTTEIDHCEDILCLCLAKQNEYLKAKAVRSLTQDRPLEEPIISNDSRSALIYDAQEVTRDFRTCNGEHCPVIQKRLEYYHLKSRLKFWHEIFFFGACSSWFIAGAIVCAKLAALWL